MQTQVNTTTIGLEAISQKLSAKLGNTNTEQTKHIVRELMELIAEELAEGKKVTFKGLFTIEPRKAQEKRGILNGKPYVTPAKTTLKIKVGKLLSEILNS